MAVLHAIACVALLRSGIAHVLGGRRPAGRLVGVAVALTVAAWSTEPLVREATTNIIRHSDATVATIELDILEAAGTGPTAVLRIENDGVRGAGSPSGGGTGLVGLGERLAGLGGDVAAHELPGHRFLVQARLPVTPQAPAARAPEAPAVGAPTAGPAP